MINYDYCSNDCLLMTSFCVIQLRKYSCMDKGERIMAIQQEIEYLGDDVRQSYNTLLWNLIRYMIYHLQLISFN